MLRWKEKTFAKARFANGVHEPARPAEMTYVGSRNYCLIFGLQLVRSHRPLLTADPGLIKASGALGYAFIGWMLWAAPAALRTSDGADGPLQK